MKKISLVTILFFYLQLLSAQEIKEVSPETVPLDVSSKDVPFTIIEDVPIFPGCEKLNLEERKYCLNKKMQMHIARKFNTSLADTLGLAEGNYKVFITFRINEIGVPDSIYVRAPHPVLKQESIRVINALPKIIPGKFRGKNVAVKYTLPISFHVDKPKRKKKKNRRN